MLPSLVDKCTEYLRPILNRSHVFIALPPAQLLGEKDVIAECWKDALKSDRFATIKRFLLEKLVERDVL